MALAAGLVSLKNNLNDKKIKENTFNNFWIANLDAKDARGCVSCDDSHY